MNEMTSRDDLCYLELPHDRIVELIWVLEGYEGVAVLRVLSKEQGLVELLISPDLNPLLDKIIADLNHSFPIRRVARPEGVESIADDPPAIPCPRIEGV